MSRPGIEPWSPGPLVNTLTIIPMANLYVAVYFWKYKKDASREQEKRITYDIVTVN